MSIIKMSYQLTIHSSVASFNRVVINVNHPFYVFALIPGSEKTETRPNGRKSDIHSKSPRIQQRTTQKINAKMCKIKTKTHLKHPT